MAKEDPVPLIVVRNSLVPADPNKYGVLIVRSYEEGGGFMTKPEKRRERVVMAWRRFRWWLKIPVNVRIWRYRLWFGHDDEFNDCG